MIGRWDAAVLQYPFASSDVPSSVGIGEQPSHTRCAPEQHKNWCQESQIGEGWHQRDPRSDWQLGSLSRLRVFPLDIHLNGSLSDEGLSLGGTSDGRHAPSATSRTEPGLLDEGMRIVFDCPSCPPSIEDMDYQWRARRSREKRSARVEVKTTPNHNEKEQKQANDQRSLALIFVSTMILRCGRDLRLASAAFPCSPSQLTSRSSHRKQHFGWPNR